MFRRFLILSVVLAGMIVTSCSDDGGGTGGRTGTGGTAGTGGSGTGGTGGGFGPQDCTISALCADCPADSVCETEDECAAGFTCIPSGCLTLQGGDIGLCAPLPGNACQSNADCEEGRECIDVGSAGNRCIKTSPDCESDLDCVRGFSCEDEACVDRRVPCLLDLDCPKSHFCRDEGNSRFCFRVHKNCLEDIDCAGAGPVCADVDADGTKECTGVVDPNQPVPTACVNSDCTDAAAPVCEISGVSTTTICGQYGPCAGGGCAEGFECVELWPDGRSECVPEGGSCSSYRDCPVRQVCASPRDGGPTACQAGVVE